MSATLDAEPIARFLGDAPRLRSEGRVHPLTIEHDARPDDRPLEKQVTSAVRRALEVEPEGDVLVFLPGAAEIRRASEALENLATLYRQADGFVVVSGEYNHSIPPALSNLLDYFLEEYFFRPSAIVCYSAGSFGGVRAAMQLRAMLCELGMPSISSIFPIPRIGESLADDGTPKDAAFDKRFTRFASEFEWYARAFAEERKKGVPY